VAIDEAIQSLMSVSTASLIGPVCAYLIDRGCINAGAGSENRGKVSDRVEGNLAPRKSLLKAHTTSTAQPAQWSCSTVTPSRRSFCSRAERHEASPIYHGRSPPGGACRTWKGWSSRYRSGKTTPRQGSSEVEARETHGRCISPLNHAILSLIQGASPLLQKRHTGGAVSRGGGANC
jgi:hypothetical protein